MRLENAMQMAHLAEERIRLLEQLNEIERLLEDIPPDIPMAAAAAHKAKNPVACGLGGGQLPIFRRSNLTTLLAQIAAEQKSLTLAEFVALATQANYVTEAKDFPNLVYQAVLKLVQRGVLEKDQDRREYRYVGDGTHP